MEESREDRREAGRCLELLSREFTYRGQGCVCVCARVSLSSLRSPIHHLRTVSLCLCLCRKVEPRVPARYESFAKGARSYRVGWERSSFEFHRARAAVRVRVAPLSKSNESSIDIVVAMPSYRRLIEEYRKAEPNLFSIGVKKTSTRR